MSPDTINRILACHRPFLVPRASEKRTGRIAYYVFDQNGKRQRILRIEPVPSRQDVSQMKRAVSDKLGLLGMDFRFAGSEEQLLKIVDEELEKGLRSIAVPIVSRSGHTVAAMALVTHTSRTTRNEMRDNFLPALRAAAIQVASAIP